MGGHEERIVAAVEAAFGSQVAFPSEPVRHASLRGEEQAVQAYVEAELKTCGYQIERFCTDASQIGTHPAFSLTTIDYSESRNMVGSRASRGCDGGRLLGPRSGHVV
jgi:acetylornithine deacetylase